MSRVHWSSRFAFVLVAAGSAIGLGNVWKFPYIAGMNGGGAFVIAYLITIAIVGVPILIAEMYIGQKAQCNAVQAFEKTDKTGTPWRFIGGLGILSGFLILSFYSVVGGWVLDFEFRSILNEFSGKTDKEISGVWVGGFKDPARMLIWHAIFMVGTTCIVLGGIKKGIERWNRILMPTLVFILLGLLVRSMFMVGFDDALAFLFKPDFSKLTPESTLEAVGHSFFTLSLGMGAMITYGSYLSEKENLVKTAFWVALMDTGIALLAGLVIFSVVFTFGLEPGAGPGLLFATLPTLFVKLPGGYLISVLFFLLVAFAAFTSAVSLLEVVVTYWTEKHNVPRKKATLTIAAIIFALGIPSALSFGGYMPFDFFDLCDKLTTNIFLPFGGLVISVFYGWILGPRAVQATLQSSSMNLAANGLMWSARILAPLAVAVVLVNGIQKWIGG